jgi:arylsulfatase A-like enzyme
MLKPAGYTTALVGKWGLGEAGSTGTPNKKGFDYFFGYLNQIKAHNYYPDYLWRNEQKVYLNNENVIADSGYAKGVGSAATKRVDYSHDLFSQEALQFVEQNQDNPFFLYLAYTIPHANNEHWIVNQHGLEVPDYGLYADMDWPEAQKGHAAMISRMDADIGALLSKLQELGLDENTLVIFTSDNGPTYLDADTKWFESAHPFQTKTGRTKGHVYEGGIRVPMIASWPEVINPGTVTNHISAFWDVMPTLCEISGAESPEFTDGTSFLPVLKSQKQKQHEYLYWEFAGYNGQQAVRMGKWKAVRKNIKNGNPGIELYNLDDDIKEETDVAEQYPEIVSAMEEIMKKEHTPSTVERFKMEALGDVLSKKSNSKQ